MCALKKLKNHKNLFGDQIVDKQVYNRCLLEGRLKDIVGIEKSDVDKKYVNEVTFFIRDEMIIKRLTTKPEIIARNRFTKHLGREILRRYGNNQIKRSLKFTKKNILVSNARWADDFIRTFRDEIDRVTVTFHVSTSSTNK